ncbi:bacillithiol system redox-active protein YtxJ [Mariniflexile litorale]|uniref:Bacillithiol system redox-active protein YtxJ n=1 Tax=Mariniflexile litorale TaxID=3045158 RepID=A0AAU7EGH5_9FLAO|nr:bacillithiol system redox-active protein YtxJ [Mariniflexile sp. KMM 9835]MDQ8211859.1 bacillithiol system redox-active protein YtxJ [Mariniflexile sp. KMM 9835]
MGIFNKLFSGSTEEKKIKTLPWIPLTTLEQLQDIETKSNSKTQVIFKHSTRCGISRMVLKQFEADYHLTESHLDLYYLDLLNYREISNEIATKFKVLHESPQLLVVKNGEVEAYESHGGINSLDLSSFI